MNYKEQNAREAFIDDIRAVEAKHGYRLVHSTPPVQVTIIKTKTALPKKSAADSSALPWWKKLFRIVDID
jgi:hypothetical protein